MPSDSKTGPRSELPQGVASRVEAVLWLAGEPLPIRRIAKLAGISDSMSTRKAIDQIQKSYLARRSSFEIREVSEGFQLLSKPQFAPWLRICRKEPDYPRLTRATLETLAIVAYRQPVLRAEIEAIRGVSCGELLRQLLDSDLLRIVGRSEELGRPLLYGTTKRFLQLYGLRNLEGLFDSAGASELRGPTKNNAGTHPGNISLEQKAA